MANDAQKALFPAAQTPTLTMLPSGRGSTYGGVTIQTNAQLEQARLEAEEATRAAEGAQLDSLGSHISKLWGEAQQAKSTVEINLLRDLRQRNGEYESDIKAKIAASGGTDIYDDITEQLCAAGVAWMKDLLLYQPDDKPYAVEATPVPSLPSSAMSEIMAHVAKEVAIAEQSGVMVGNDDIEEYREKVIKSVTAAVKEMATEAAEKMSKKIDDIVSECGWDDAFKEFLEDFVTFRAAFLERTVQVVKVLKFDDSTGMTIASTEEKEQIRVERFSPLDAYPSNDATNPNEGYFFRRQFLARSVVSNMKSMDGYNDANIDHVIENWGGGKQAATATVDGERARLEGKNNTVMPHGDNMEALKWWGSVTGKMLIEWAPADKPPMVDGVLVDEAKDYGIAAIFMGGKVIKAKINPDPVGRRPVYSACYRGIPGSFWGKGVSMLLLSPQTEINSLARAKGNNIGFASMPMMAVDVSKLPPGMSVQSLYPGCIIQFENRTNDTGDIVKYYQPQLIAPQLENMLQTAYRRAEDRAGIPPYQYGQQKTAGAGATLGGLEILQGASSRGIKDAIGNIDTGVIKPFIRDLWVHLMIFDPDESIKGDVNIEAKGAMAKFSQQTVTMRRIELMNATANQMDSQIKGILGRAKELREAYKATGLDPKGIVPDDDELKAKFEPPQPSMVPTAPVDQVEPGQEVAQ